MTKETMTAVTKNRNLHALGFAGCIYGAWFVASQGISVKAVVAMVLLTVAAIANAFGFVRANTWFHQRKP